MKNDLLGRELTNEEHLYWRLMFAYCHYDSDPGDRFERCSELLTEVRNSNLADDFKKRFEGLAEDKISKLVDTHYLWMKGMSHKYNKLFGQEVELSKTQL